MLLGSALLVLGFGSRRDAKMIESARTAICARRERFAEGSITIQSTVLSRVVGWEEKDEECSASLEDLRHFGSCDTKAVVSNFTIVTLKRRVVSSLSFGERHNVGIATWRPRKYVICCEFRAC